MKKLNKKITINGDGCRLNKTQTILTLIRVVNVLIDKVDEIVEWINQQED